VDQGVEYSSYTSLSCKSHSFVHPIGIVSSRILDMALCGRLFSLVRPSQFYVHFFQRFHCMLLLVMDKSSGRLVGWSQAVSIFHSAYISPGNRFRRRGREGGGQGEMGEEWWVNVHFWSSKRFGR